MKRTSILAGAAMTSAALISAVLLLGNTNTPEQVDCPSSGEQNRIGLVEATSTAREPELLQTRLRLVRQQLVEAGVCGGPIIVQAWTNLGAISTIWSTADHLDIHGGTDTARANRAGPAVDQAMEQVVVPRLNKALEELPAEGSDFLAWRRLVADALAQIDPEGRREAEVLVLADGVQQTDELDLNRPLSIDEATELAKAVPISTDLSGIDLTIIGLGQVAGDPPPSGGDWVEAIRTFADITCKATKAICTALSTSVEQSS